MAHKQGKHSPQRTCIACRQVAGKRQLIRLVRSESGVEVDVTGKRAGRGAYVHASRACWQRVLASNQLNAALRTSLSAENRTALVDFMMTLPSEEEPRVPDGE